MEEKKRTCMVTNGFVTIELRGQLQLCHWRSALEAVVLVVVVVVFATRFDTSESESTSEHQSD